MTNPAAPRGAERPPRGVAVWAAFVLLLAAAGTARAQQLEPRAYSPAPIGTNYFGVSYSYSSGDVSLDPSVPIENVQASINGVAPYFGHTFGLLGRLASLGVAVPTAWGTVTGDVMESRRSVERSGFGDPQLRFAVNLTGGPALSLADFLKHKPETTLGASLVVVCPWGQYDDTRLINLGTNRWAAKPELGLSYPMGKWSFELYAGLWVFAENTDFFGGHVRKQDPLAAYQAHLVRTFGRGKWAAFDFTYYSGGATTLDGQRKDDRQDNTRAGLTFAVPVTKHQSLKATYANGVTARIGSKFQTIAVAWQYLWFDPAKRPAGS